MKINWQVRINNKLFWMAVISALALVAQAVAALLGYTIDLTSLVGKLQAVVDAVFGLLVVLGLVVDPTTEGIGDSKRAMTYTTPWKDPVITEEDLQYMNYNSDDQPCPPPSKGE